MATNIGDYVDLAYKFQDHFTVVPSVLRPFLCSIQPYQIKKEITKFLELAYALGPKSLIEIGTANGGTLFLFCRIANPQATIVSIDLRGIPDWRKQFINTFAKDKQRLHLIRGDSHNNQVLGKVQAISPIGFDLLFIDGDHSYRGVKKDFDMYSNLIKSGIIAFHDITPHDRTHDPKGVVRVVDFWNEIKESYRYLEIVEDKKQGWGGIGVLFV